MIFCLPIYPDCYQDYSIVISLSLLKPEITKFDTENAEKSLSALWFNFLFNRVLNPDSYRDSE